MKPILPSVFIIAGPRERLGEEDDVGILARGSRAISHSQNGTGFVCGLSTRNTLHAAVDPEADDVVSSACQSACQSAQSKLTL